VNALGVACIVLSPAIVLIPISTDIAEVALAVAVFNESLEIVRDRYNLSAIPRFHVTVCFAIATGRQNDQSLMLIETSFVDNPPARNCEHARTTWSPSLTKRSDPVHWPVRSFTLGEFRRAAPHCTVARRAARHRPCQSRYISQSRCMR